MAADIPKTTNASMDAFQFIKDVAIDGTKPNIWKLNRVIISPLPTEPREPMTGISAAQLMKTVILPNWHLISLNREKYNRTVYADAKDADWKDNPAGIYHSQRYCDQQSKLNLH